MKYKHNYVSEDLKKKVVYKQKSKTPFSNQARSSCIKRHCNIERDC